VKRFLLWALAIALSAAVVCVAVDVVERIGTLEALSRGYGTPDNPTPAESKLAGANVILLMGFALGLGTGVSACVAAALWWRLLRTRATVAERAMQS
jgi:hypothetical protein